MAESSSIGLSRQPTEPTVVFIRSPDHSVTGYERDLTPGHYTIHPFFHSITSILECCARLVRSVASTSAVLQVTCILMFNCAIILIPYAPDGVTSSPHTSQPGRVFLAYMSIRDHVGSDTLSTIS